VIPLVCAHQWPNRVLHCMVGLGQRLEGVNLRPSLAVGKTLHPLPQLRCDRPAGVGRTNGYCIAVESAADSRNKQYPNDCA
jgi:hypothetical protein